MNQITEAGRQAFHQAVEQKMKESGAIGMAVAVVDRNGETQYQEFFGVADKKTGQKIDEDTIFGIASVTKSFVTLCVMQLCEQGKLDLDDPVSKYLPEFHPQQTQPVRIRHLLSHSAGFFPVPRILLTDVAESLGRTEEKDGDLSFLPDVNKEALNRVVNQLNKQAPGTGISGAPGQYMSYCNDGFGIMSEVVRRVSGYDTFAHYLRDNVLDPLGMSRSGAEYLRPRLDSNASVRYEYRNGSLWGERDFYDTAFALPGAGAVCSTLADLKKYAVMYLNRGVSLEGRRIAAASSIHTMCQPRVAVNDQSDYGLGLMVKKLDDLSVVGHGGSQPGVSSYLLWSYGVGAAVIVLCNTADVPSGWIANAAMRMYHGRDPLTQDGGYMPMTWTREEMERVCGTYGSDEGGDPAWKIYMENDSLRLCRDGKPLEVVPVQKEILEYQTGSGSGRLLFYFDETGRAFAMTPGSRMYPRMKD